MARLVTKFKFIQPGKRAGNYLHYIATREGVDKIDDSKRLLPATKKQKDLIQHILRNFPDAKDMLEYEDYQRRMTIGAASEFITRAIEDNAGSMVDSRTYADYIATRPRAERFGSHGLFTDDGVAIELSKVSEELNNHTGNVWMAIISLRREDAERLGFNNGSRWRDMLRAQTRELAENLKIPLEDLHWYAAFHNESHHPHVHLIAYSTVENEGYLTQKGVMNLRSAYGKSIFAQDLLSVYENQTERRDDLRQRSKEIIAEIVAKINSGSYDNPKVEELLLRLSQRLANTSGKKVYGYLKADVKGIIDSVVEELASDERISTLYDLWYEQKEAVLRTYTEDMPPRIPLVQNKEFKSIKNAIIQEALNLSADHVVEDLPEDAVPEPESLPAEEEAVEPVQQESTEPETGQPAAPPPPMTEWEWQIARAESGNRWAQYALAKWYLDKDSEKYDLQEAVRWLVESAKQGCTVAKYRLGKLFLRGEEVPRNVDYALHWLEEAAARNDPFAQYLLGKILLRGEDTEQDALRAEQLLTASADQGNQYAQYTLGKACLDGDILPQDISKALELLEKSAGRGFAPAQYILGKLLYRGEVTERDVARSLSYLEQVAAQENTYAAYLAGKIRLTEDGYKDGEKAVSFFRLAARRGNHYAEYQLGKLYLYGKEVERDEEAAIRWLMYSAGHGNQYAQQLLQSVQSGRNWYAAMGALRLLQHLSKILQNRMEDGRKSAMVDRKLRRKINEKKQAHGLKQG